MSKFLVLIVLVAVDLISVSASAERYRVLCESRNYQYRQCLVAGQVQDAYIVQEHSDRACIPNHAYGMLQNGVWVDRGCRAVFEIITVGRNRQTFDLTCLSNDRRYRFCPVGGYVLDAFVTREHSGTPCIQGRNWGIQRDGIWVDMGCTATFRVTIER